MSKNDAKQARSTNDEQVEDQTLTSSEDASGMQEKPTPAEMYEEFLVPGIHARWTPIFLELAAPKRGERVLDVACGTGVVTRNVAAKIGADGELVAVDENPDMLAVAQKHTLPDDIRVEWVECDAHDLPFPDGSFELVLCQQALQFFDDPAMAVQELERVLTDGGRAVVSVWEGLDSHPLYAALLKSEARYLEKPIEEIATPFMMGDADDLRELFDEAGFARVDVVQESHEVRFPSPDRFVELTLLAAAAIIPPSEMDEEARGEMIRSISREVQPELQKAIQGDVVAFPMHANIAVAYAS